MNHEETVMPISDIVAMLSAQNIFVDEMKFYQKNKRVTDYLLDDKYMLRISTSVLNERLKLERAKTISFVQKIHAYGSFTFAGQKYHYLIIDYVQGADLWSVIQNLTDVEKYNIGTETAHFLDELHSITGASYDIGHYIATVPNWKGSWKEGHLKYVEILRYGITQMDIGAASRETVSKAFGYIDENISSLEYQTGARLLHNDFHPKNIIIYEGQLAGIIDWECSQFGEADFELAHLFHWCIYPSNPDNHLSPYLQSVMKHLSSTLGVPNLEKRLIIYQLEHELNQLIWNGLKQEEERMQRINGWLSGQINALLGEW